MFRFPKNSSIQSPSKRTSVIGNQLMNKGLCKYPHGHCSLLCLDNYDYCLKHILEDKSSPYKPCPFLYTVSGKKCGKPAYRPDRKDTWFCAEHTRKNNLLRHKTSSKPAPPPTQEALLASLSHYARTDQSPNLKSEENEHEESAVNNSSLAVNPFVDVDATTVNAQSSQVLDCASGSDSDVEGAMLDNVWRALDNESSDAESVDSQAEDPLKHAGVYTAEEVTVVIKDKMIRLQSLYIDQFRRLHHLLKERRRKYLHALKKEKETLCSIHDQEKTTAKEQKLYQKLKALNHFHRYYGVEAILHKKSLDRRGQVTEGTLPRTSHKGKCAFTEGGVKCGAKTLPVTKYCRKHILEDNQQVLFRACGFKRDDHTCQEPTLNVFENATCVYHTTLPIQPHNSRDMSEKKENIKVEKEAVKNTNVEMEVAVTSDVKIEKHESSTLESVETLTKSANLENAVTKTKDPLASTEKPAEPVLSELENVGGSTSESTCVPYLQTEKENVGGSTSESTSVPYLQTVKENVGGSTSESTCVPYLQTEKENVGASTSESTCVPYLQTEKENVGVSTSESTCVPYLQTEKENVGGSTSESTCVPYLQTEKENMDTDSGPGGEEALREESQTDELVMVDMMTDVGVVEEVLESEGKVDTGESMDISMESKKSPEEG